MCQLEKLILNGSKTNKIADRYAMSKHTQKSFHRKNLKNLKKFVKDEEQDESSLIDSTLRWTSDEDEESSFFSHSNRPPSEDNQ